MSSGSLEHFRVGRWNTSDRDFLRSWLSNTHEQSKRKLHMPLHPVIQEFQDLIENDAELYMLFSCMFVQIPTKPPYNKDPTGKHEVRSYQQMLRMLDHILSTAPEYNEAGLVGLPINAVLDWAMGTSCGFAAFLNKKVNKQLKKILNAWAIFLRSPASCEVLNDHPTKGWFGASAQKAIPNFVDQYKCDPSKPHYGFKSWDEFFTREFKDGVRPVESPEDDSVISNVCESGPYHLVSGVKHRDTFWIKGQPYSVSHMLSNDPLTEKFVGGTVYQAFLSATSYHRWHSPVNGTVIKTKVVEGSYYAEAPVEGFDPSGPDCSQGYITEIATRGMIFIQANNPKIGLVCVLQVGMGDVSSCDITVYAGQKVKKGDQIGMFHFGGSTYCLMFGPNVKLDFDLRGEKPGLYTKNIPVNSRIATVKS